MLPAFCSSHRQSAPPGTALVTHDIVITVAPEIAGVEEHFAVFISRKTVVGSFACELGTQVSFSAEKS